MKLFGVLSFILVISFSPLFPESNKWEYRSDILELTKSNGDNIKELKGNVFIDHGNVDLYTEYAQVNDSKNLIKLKGQIQVIDSSKTIVCDEMIYYRDRGKSAIAWGNVRMQENDRIITCDSLYYWKTDGYRETSFRAIGDVKIKGRDEFISAESVSYDDYTQIMDLFDSASLEKGNRKIQGDSLYIHFNDSLMKRVDVIGNAYAFNDIDAKISEDSGLYKFMDVMNSKKMMTDFDGQNITKVKMTGMASALYNVIEDTLLQGYNDVSGDTVLLSFNDDVLNRMEVFGGCRGSFVPEGNNSGVDSTVVYRADFIDYRIDEERSYFKRNSRIDYKETTLEADYVQVDWKSNILKAVGDAFTKPSVTTGDSNDPMIGDTLYYNLSTEKGRIIKGKTKINDSYYHGETIYSSGDNNIYSSDAKYTSCDLDNPHFYLQSSHMKIRKGEDIIARPVILKIYDLPIMGFPFAVLPNGGGKRRGGWIMPSFSYLSSKGTHMEHLGYYIPFNQYADYTVFVDVWDRDRVLVKNELDYYKRDVLSGSVKSTIDNTLQETIDNTLQEALQVDTQDISLMFKDYNIMIYDFTWNHNWKIDEFQGLKLNYTYASENDFYQKQNMGFNPNDQTALKQTLNSYATYKKIIGDNNTLSIGVAETYNLLAEDEIPDSNIPIPHKTQKLPYITYSQPQKPIFGSGDRWYNPIKFSLYSKISLQKQIGRFFDSSDGEIKDTTKIDNGAVHDMTISTSSNMFGWLGITPYVNLKETWIYGYEPTEDENSIINVFDRNSSTFRRRMTGSANLSITTNIYGMFPGNIFKLKAIRHTMSPTIKYTYTPSFIKPGEHDYFAGMGWWGDIVSTPSNEVQGYTFKLYNTFQAKKDSIEDTIDLFTYNIETGVENDNDSGEWRWNSIYSYFDTKIYGSHLSVDLTHDLYDENEKWNNSPRLVGAYALLTSNFYLLGKSMDDNIMQPADTLSTDQGETISNDNQDASYASPWYAILSSSYSLNKQPDGWVNKFSMDASIGLKLTKNWNLKYDIGYNIADAQMTKNILGLTRQLHCWVFDFAWSPGIGPDKLGQGFRIHIHVKDPNLEDIRVRDSGGVYEGVY